MATSNIAEGYLPRGKKLVGISNYKGWSKTIRSILTRKDLERYIRPDHGILVEKDEGYIRWKVDNAKACLFIKLNCSAEPAVLIGGLTAANEIWKRLEHCYKGYEIDPLYESYNAFTSLSYEDSNSIS